MHPIMTDKELLAAYYKGDNTAFDELYERYWGLLFNHARRLLKDADLAKDAVQDVFLNLVTKSVNIDHVKSLPGFLTACMRNRIINTIVREKLKDNYIKQLESYHLNDFASIEEDIFQKREETERQLQERIESEISLLPPKMRTAFELAKKHHLSYREIAQRTGSSEGTIKKHIHVALRTLRDRLLPLISALFFLRKF